MEEQQNANDLNITGAWAKFLLDQDFQFFYEHLETQGKKEGRRLTPTQASWLKASSR